MADVLPTPRALLTSLINTLSSIPPAAVPTQAPSSNPLKFLPPSQARPLLATLHTLYPNVLLPALDLLDRRLVTRIIPLVHGDVATAPAQQNAPIGNDEPEVTPKEVNETQEEEPNFFYLIRSAQQPSRRGRRAIEAALNEGGAGPTYVVQTRAWNCSCAAFAFSAFPAETASPVYHISASSLPRQPNATAARVSGNENRQEGEENDAWEFGGMSKDGLNPEHEDDGVVGTGGVPCCKHLLACVLAERWKDVLGGYVAERRAGKEEAAGLVAGI
ncbi:coproporphyrinogen III oxidase [Apiospora aurea]|uniref:Coproporphyrinogen III oxidase n=1 Tax=Apiospora aurea TaxID=335848 RepID=A0ABR1Q8Z0_9PEZI